VVPNIKENPLAIDQQQKKKPKNMGSNLLQFAKGPEKNVNTSKMSQTQPKPLLKMKMESRDGLEDPFSHEFSIKDD